MTETWPLTSRLDIAKETDLRPGFTDRLRSSIAYEALDRAVLRLRLLLCLNGLGTNVAEAHGRRPARRHLQEPAP